METFTHEHQNPAPLSSLVSVHSPRPGTEVDLPHLAVAAQRPLLYMDTCAQRSTRWPGNSVFSSILKIGFIPQAIRRKQLLAPKKILKQNFVSLVFPLKKKKSMFIQMFKIVVILVETCLSNVTCRFGAKSIFSTGTFSA